MHGPRWWHRRCDPRRHGLALAGCRPPSSHSPVACGQPHDGDSVFGTYSKGPSDTEFHVFDGRGHSLTIDNGWKNVADVTLTWLAGKGF